MRKGIQHIKLDAAIKEALKTNKVEGNVFPWDQIESNIQKKFRRKHPFKDFSFSLNSFVGAFSLTSFIDKNSVFASAKKWSVSASIAAGSIVVAIGGYFTYQSFSSTSDKTAAINKIAEPTKKEDATQMELSNFSFSENIENYAEQLKKGSEPGMSKQENQTAILAENTDGNAIAVTSTNAAASPVVNHTYKPASAKTNDKPVNDFSNFNTNIIAEPSTVEDESLQLLESSNVGVDNTSELENSNEKKTSEVRANDETADALVADGKKGLLNKLFTTNPKSRYKRR